MLNAIETIEMWSKENFSEVSKFSVSSLGQIWKLRNPRNEHFFLSNHIVKLKNFCLRSFFRFLDFEFHILQKIEVKETFSEKSFSEKFFLD